MAKTKKLATPNPDPNTVPDPNPADPNTVTTKRGRKPGKDIIPRLRVIDGQSFILMASSRVKELQTGLLWAPAPKDPENAFAFMFDIPSGDDDGSTVVISVPMGQRQAQATYAAHPRRVPIHELPPECPLVAVVEVEKPPRAPKAPELPTDPSNE